MARSLLRALLGSQYGDSCGRTVTAFMRYWRAHVDVNNQIAAYEEIGWRVRGTLLIVASIVYSKSASVAKAQADHLW
jgi:hypothetical protein